MRLIHMQPSPGSTLSAAELPSLTLADLVRFQKEGFVTVGVLVALLANSKLLLLAHRASLKNQSNGALGPLAETTVFCPVDQRVEQPVESFARGLQEELGMSDLALTHLQLQYYGSFTTTWPVGKGNAHAICPVLECGNPELIPAKVDTPEVHTTQFLTLPSVQRLTIPKVRSGVPRFLEGLCIFLEEHPTPRESLTLEAPLPFTNALDIDLDVMRF